MTMPDLESVPARICLEYVSAVRATLCDLLFQHRRWEAGRGQVVKEKSTDHSQYEFDLVAHDLLFKLLSAMKVDATVFSEENANGWETVGTAPEYTIVVDPFDQSATTMRTFRL